MSLRPRISFDIYYYEKIGPRYYLRITPLSIILMLLAIVIGFTILLLDVRKQEKWNVNLNAPTPTPYSTDPTIIHQAQPHPLPKSNIQPKAAIPQSVQSSTKVGNN
jgi:hypothetical protein